MDKKSSFLKGLYVISFRDKENEEDVPKEPFSLYGTLPRSWKEKNLVTNVREIEDEEEINRLDFVPMTNFNLILFQSCLEI